MSVAVLCRGTSLAHIDRVPEVDKYIIVNRFGDELENETISSRLIDKELIQVLSLVPDEPKLMIERGHYKKFNVVEFVLPYLKETIPGPPPQIIGRDGYIPTRVLDDTHKNYMITNNPRYAFCYPTSGVASVAYATLECNVTEVHIIGLDFYETAYAYGKEFPSDEVAIRRGEDSLKMRGFLKNFIKLNPFTLFNIYTHSTFNPNLENVKVIKV